MLSSNGKKPPSALHEATAYATTEEAIQASPSPPGLSAVAPRSVPTSNRAGWWWPRDQATAVVAKVADGKDLVRTTWCSAAAAGY